MRRPPDIEPARQGEAGNEDGALRLSRGWRWTLYGVAAVVLGLAFAAYRSAEMVLLWETFLTLCGVR